MLTGIKEASSLDHGRSLSEAARQITVEEQDKVRAGALRIES